MPRRKTDAEFKKEVYDLVGDEYTFLDSYVNGKTKLKVKHNKCGNVYKVTPSNFLCQHSHCPYCSNNANKTDFKFKKEVYDLVGTDYIFLDNYVNSYTKIKVKHNECGNIYKVTPSHFLEGTRCPFCSAKNSGEARRKTGDKFKREVLNLVGNEYTFLDDYVNNDTKLRVKHNECGNIYSVRPTDFISHHTRCPYCAMPKSEKIIAKILDMFNIDYESQKAFDDLVDKTNLSYDFFIPSQNTLIEYQGIQHYEPIETFGGEDQLELQQKHDKMKADYAKTNNYNLIAVPYTEDTFSKIKKYLLQHGLDK